MMKKPTSEDFYAALDEIRELHDRKQSDYGRAEAPFANVEASEDFGIAPWVGALVRGNDKMRRLQKAAMGGTLANEGIEDSLMDLAVYALIGLVEFRAAAAPLGDPYQFDQTDEQLAAEWLEKNRNFDGRPDGYDLPVTNLIGSLFGIPVRISTDVIGDGQFDPDIDCADDCPCNTGETPLDNPKLCPSCQSWVKSGRLREDQTACGSGMVPVGESNDAAVAPPKLEPRPWWKEGT